MGICIFKTLVPTAVCCCIVADFYLSYISSCVSRSELSEVSARVWPLDPHNPGDLGHKLLYGNS